MRNGIEFHSQGFVDIMTCGAVDELCREHAMRIYAAASAEGGEFSVESKIVSRYTDRKYGGEARQRQQQIANNGPWLRIRGHGGVGQGA